MSSSLTSTISISARPEPSRSALTTFSPKLSLRATTLTTIDETKATVDKEGDMEHGSQPDKRNAAYESIFGSRHNARTSSTYSYDPYQAHYQTHVAQDRQSYAGSIAPSITSATSYTNGGYTIQTTYLQPTSHSQPTYYATSIAQPQVQYYQAQGYQSAAYYSTYVAPSVGNSYSLPQPPGVVAPLPNQEPPDAGLEHLTRTGLTPAQAYQAQVYLNSPGSHPQRPHSSSTPPSEYSQRTPNPNRHPSPQPSHTSTARSSQATPQLPALHVDHGGLGLADLNAYSQDGLGNEQDWTSSSNGSHHIRSASSSTSQGSFQDSDYSPRGSQRHNTLHLTPTASSPQSYTSDLSPTSRRSSDSTRTMPRSSYRRSVPAQDRTRSMSSSTPKAHSMVDFGQIPPLPPSHYGPGSSKSTAVVMTTRRTPVVYPALLSNVADAFKARIAVTERIKDGLAYQDAFDGREAVDKIAYIIKTTDRNLALLLGRALDAQKFFHDVTYDHRLRDSPHEIYQFRSRLPSPFVSADEVTSPSSGTPTSALQARGPLLPDINSLALSTNSFSSSSTSPFSETSTLSPLNATSSTRKGDGRYTRHRAASVSSTDDLPLPSGVFTLLTDCYSPTCTRDALCYSIACPRRLEQQARLNMKPQPGLRRSTSSESLDDYGHQEAGTLWIHSVPQEVVDSVSDTEKKRQEAINEVIYTERDFVKDMEYLRDFWIKPLQASDIIPEQRRTDFIEQVFWNIHEIIAVNIRLRDALRKRQQSYAVVETIGDIFLEVAPHFQPFVKYGAHQLYGKYEFEKEKASNPAFAQFVDEVERIPESRKLELNGYLTKPTTRLARYPLLLQVVLKHTPEENPDKYQLVEVIKIVKSFLEEVNEESGKTENRFNLVQLDQQLVFRNMEAVDLRLRDENRELLFKGLLKKDGGDLQVFLFDHALLMVKPKTKHEQYRVYRRPIPLELLVVSAHDDVATTRSNRDRDRPGLGLPVLRQETRNGYAISFMYLGRKGYVITLWASTPVGRKKWLEAIAKQQEVLRTRSMTFETATLSEGFFYGDNKVLCAAPFNHGRRLAFGTSKGVYFADLRNRTRDPLFMLALPEVTQVDIIEEQGLLIVLADRAVMTIPMDALEVADPTAGLKRARRIASGTTFFKAGFCLGRTLVCIVKATTLSSTIKTLEPTDQSVRSRNKPTLRNFLQGGNDTLRLFKEVYIPSESSSIHFLKTKLCVGCTKGFEIFDLETLEVQCLLDPSDPSLNFVQPPEQKPIAIYRIENEFLLCYDQFAFYVNKSGWRARPQWIVHWEGRPTAFALHYPFVLAFEPTFVEVRHVDTGTVIQIIPGNNLRCLFADTPPSHTNSPAEFYNKYPHFRNLYTGRHSLHQPPYGVAPPPYPHSNYPYGGPGQAQAQYRPQPYTRDEIILVSEDRVMAVRLAPPLPPPSPSPSRNSQISGTDESLGTASSTLVGSSV